MAAVSSIFVVLISSLLACYSVSFPLCTNSRASFELKSPLNFCQYKGSACCDSAEDSKLQKQFEAMNISDPQCASVLRSILCAKCDVYSGGLFDIDVGLRSVPILCNSVVSAKSYQSKADDSIDFCTKVWDTCGRIPIYNSPFSPPVKGTIGILLNPSPTKLIDRWPSKKDFCTTFGGSPDDKMMCFNGESASFSSSEGSPSIKGICLEKIGNGSYVSMNAHPDGSDRVFLASQGGKIWLATVPLQGSNGVLGIDESKPFLDISDQVLLQTNYGLLGMAFHPEFVRNGRFFVSFNCDKLKHSGCSGRCACNADVECDPASLSSEKGILPCQYHDVVAEYSVNGVPSHAKTANPLEVRRIFTVGLLQRGHASQILFGPTDGYLYYLTQDRSRKQDSYIFSQNKKSVLGKILRLDVDKMPSAKEVDDKNLWGNYSIPEDNLYIDDKEFLPEIWALGFRNLWRCSFDAERPSYFLCGDAGQDLYDEVNIVAKGGNYGWPIYEGPFLSSGGQSQKGKTPPSSINPIFPVMGYNRSQTTGSASIISGFFYRSRTDPCLYGRYLYKDLYTDVFWVGTEKPKNSGNFTTIELSYTCAKDSPLPCNTVSGKSTVTTGYTFSFGEDNRKDIYILTSSGVYRIVHPSRCKFSCSEDNQSGSVGQGQGPPSSLSCSPHRTKLLSNTLLFWLFVYCAVYYLAG